MTIPTSSTSSSDAPGWRAALGFAALLALLLAALNLIAHWAEGPERVGDLRASLLRARGAAVVVSGPSTAKHITPEALCGGANIALHGLDIFEADALAHNVLDHTDRPQVWIIGIIPGTFATDNGSPATTRRIRRGLTYRTLHSGGDWPLIGGDWKTALRTTLAPALGFREWRFRATQIWRTLQGRSRRRPDRRYITKTIADEGADLRLARKWAAERSAEGTATDYRLGDVTGRSLADFERYAARVQSNGGKVVLVYMPISPEMRAVYAAELPRSLAAKRKATARVEAAGVLVIDDTAHFKFADDLASFRDSVHLNYQTGFAYSRDLARRLAERGIIGEPRCPMPSPVVLDQG